LVAGLVFGIFEIEIGQVVEGEINLSTGFSVDLQQQSFLLEMKHVVVDGALDEVFETHQ
jgi:hypothetical protein